MSEINIDTTSIKYAIKNSNVSIHQKCDANRDLSILENEIEILKIQLKQASERLEPKEATLCQDITDSCSCTIGKTRIDSEAWRCNKCGNITVKFNYR